MKIDFFMTVFLLGFRLRPQTYYPIFKLASVFLIFFKEKPLDGDWSTR